jgi:hypothetical protein
MAMSAHPVVWQSPQPLWGRFADAGGGTGSAAAADQPRPALLRFATDDFMEQTLATLVRDPAQIGLRLARPETWRKPADDSADLIERTPVPRLAQDNVRRGAALKPRTGIGATAASTSLDEQGRPRDVPLKLYQPAHQRHYLTAASLVCRTPGMPERAVVPGGAEQINFVIRRLLPALPNGNGESCEFAWVKDAPGARWQRVNDAGADAARLAPGEELLPVFPLPFRDDAAHARTLWAGLVPVGRREEYMGGAVDRSAAPGFALGQRQSLAQTPSPSTAAGTARLARVTQFQMEVAEPWKNLIRTSFTPTATAAPDDVANFGGSELAAGLSQRAFEFNLRQQMASWLILLDLADYLEAYLGDLWSVIDTAGAGFDALSPRRKELYTWLGNAAMPPALETALLRPPADGLLKQPRPSLRAALLAVRGAGVRDGLERTELIYNDATHEDAAWPPFHFVLAGLDRTGAARGPFEALAALGAASAGEVAPDPLVTPAVAGQQAAAQLDRLTALVGRALDETTQERDAPPIPFALQLKNALAANAGDAGWFVIRFVYTRRDCGPLHPPLLSVPTQRFQLANFFDPDAPARPIRVTLPLDTSPAGLRKFNKNTAFVISDMLCGQIQRAKGLGLGDLVRSVLPWPLHKDLDVGAGSSCNNGGGLNIGMICSLSIPIITICALILLIIIVTLLDMIFRWLPYFVICFPVPGLKGKKGGS